MFDVAKIIVKES